MDKSSRLTLVLGHAASGKSAWAEAQVLALGGRPTYVATAALGDAEMAAKARAHAARRGDAWVLIEGPEDLAATCRALTGPVLVDCATMWLTRLMMEDRDWQEPAAGWIDAMRGNRAIFHVVSNDVGGGVTPDNALARGFQRAQGELNQRLAAAADRVVLVTAGLPQVLK
ncbi:bifunctional adenosylcobinamide kinase/adenosylcobinamide-phosphate guanylyltransferase [Jannaschia formosa]|uniref:bifunctional adenosylcobinamide kinase/adenosylcobinamide-phosphate guanylyltransferase n=1 Tax=Jannaschia formosa TaxID=2259592 RepID=UPI000E1B85B1|nr:bifunctional adenosylcobinamide kinase/adenosylcobinamide-phosphate guanylyltransferase [Jannaschia formosa]TFL18004.1 bifunctional adenosylcobinamide kinase/adenosylcobinamide-phosphate guanylyltransferase [Jannaschia formosa]